MSKKGTGQLEGKIDEIIEMLHEGDSYRTIAEKLGVKLTTLADYTSNAEHSARVREALKYSASTFDDKAEKVLLEAESHPVEMARAKELAQLYKWRASKRNPRDYGDTVDITSDGKELKGNTCLWGGKTIPI